MKTLLFIIALGALAFFWHRHQTDQLSAELEAAQTALKEAKEQLATNSEAVRAAAEEVKAASPTIHSEPGQIEALTAEADKLRVERDTLRAELDALRAPKAPIDTSYDSSPINSFDYQGTRLIEARITDVSPEGVTVTGKDGKSVVVDLDLALKLPELRIRARNAIQAAIAAR